MGRLAECLNKIGAALALALPDCQPCFGELCVKDIIHKYTLTIFEQTVQSAVAYDNAIITRLRLERPT